MPCTICTFPQMNSCETFRADRTDLGMSESTVAQPYKKTMTPTTAAGISICVYTPNQAKYNPIFSPKYFLCVKEREREGEREREKQRELLSRYTQTSAQGCVLLITAFVAQSKQLICPPPLFNLLL